MKVEKPIILALTDGKAGHETQTHGIIHLLNEQQDYEVIWISVKKIPKLVQQIFRHLVNVADSVFALDYFIDRNNLPLQHERVKFIISAGGNTLIANVLCARFFKNAQNIIASSLRGIKPKNFDVVFSIQPQQCEAPYLYYPISPSKLVQDIDGKLKFQARQSLNIPQDKMVLTVLIGADTKHVEIGSAEQFADYIKLAKNKLAADAVLISTSRRTDLSFEEKMQCLYAASQFDQTTWVAHGQSCDIKQYIYASDLIICSQESESMIGEAVISGRPVIVAQLGEMKNSNYQSFIDNLVQSGDILYLKTNEVAQLNLEDFVKNTRLKNHEQLLRGKMLSYLGKS